VFAILAILNSALANANAGVNAASRVLYAMGRAKSLPSALAHVDRRFRTPDVAIVFCIVVGIGLALWPGLVYGPSAAFGLIGIMTTILILLVYMATCLAVPFYYLREHRDEFHAWRHVLLPAIPFIVLVVPIVAQFYPAPPAPLNLAGPICAAWFVIGVVIVSILSSRAPKTLERGSDVYLG
jgi:amino acid transporter